MRGADELSAIGVAAGKGPQQNTPQYVCHRHHTQRTQRDHRKEETPREGFELAGELRRSFTLRNPQDGGFRFGDGG